MKGQEHEQLLVQEDVRDREVRDEFGRTLADRMYGTENTWREEQRHNPFLEGEE